MPQTCRPDCKLVPFLLLGNFSFVSLGVTRSHFQTISLGQGQGPIAAKMISQVIFVFILTLFIYLSCFKYIQLFFLTRNKYL